VPSFAQTNNQPAARQGSSGCVRFQQACSNKPYPTAQTAGGPQQNGSAATPAAANREPATGRRLAQGRERGTADTYRLGEPNRYYSYAPGAQIGPMASSGTQWCAMRFRSYNPATGFDGTPHACP
jgi:BA14K-like protein